MCVAVIVAVTVLLRVFEEEAVFVFVTVPVCELLVVVVVMAVLEPVIDGVGVPVLVILLVNEDVAEGVLLRV